MKPLAAALLLCLLLANASDVSSCGPFLPSAEFINKSAPDHAPEFFAGQLGILRPTFERRYLAMAYRILNGEPLNASQQAAVTDLDRYRAPALDAAVKQWQAASHGSDPVDPYRRSSDFSSTAVCGADAFVTARKTLEQLTRQAGADSDEVKGWLNAQHQVFADCSGATEIPDPAPAESGERVRSNRAYQIAAAYFYSGNFEEARKRWREIAADLQSPWHGMAPYLVARSYLREGKYKEAEAQLTPLLADPALREQAQRLLDFARARIDPTAQLLVLSNRLMEPNPADIGHDLNDYTFLFDHFENGFVDEFAPGATDTQMQAVITARYGRLKSIAEKSDLTAWIAEFQNAVTTTHDELARWRQTKSPAWLIAAAHWDEAEVLDDLIKVPPSSPVYATARFYAAHMLTGKKPEEAATLLDAILDQPAEVARFDASTLNTFHEQRMRVAQTFDEFLRNAPRTVVYVDNADLMKNLPPDFDNDAATIFDLDMPITLWRKAVSTRSLPSNLRSRLAQAGFVRSLILGDSPNSFAVELAKLKPAYASELASISKLTGAEQRFTAIFWILHHPELTPEVNAGLYRQTPDGHIDDFRENWWCPHSAVTPEPNDALFLTPAERKQGLDEVAKLQKAEDAPQYLASEVVLWAGSHPTDQRNAEALALAVKTSRYTCGGAASHTSVESAFQMLHQRYPKSKWANQTPYWY